MKAMPSLILLSVMKIFRYSYQGFASPGLFMALMIEGRILASL